MFDVVEIEMDFFSTMLESVQQQFGVVVNHVFAWALLDERLFSTSQNFKLLDVFS